VVKQTSLGVAFTTHFNAAIAVVVLLLLAGCTKNSLISEPATMSEPRISAEELRAYCPRVVLPDNGAFYTVYERGGEEDPARIIYRAAIDKVTRACRYMQGQMTMEVAAAGRIVPGPKFNPANINLPIYVWVRRGEEVLYDKNHQLNVLAGQHGQATQFLFKDDSVTFAQPDARNVIVRVGFLPR